MKRTSACKPWLEGVTMRGTDPLGQGSRVADALLEGKLREKGLLERFQLGHKVYYIYDAGKATNILIISPPQ